MDDAALKDTYHLNVIPNAIGSKKVNPRHPDRLFNEFVNRHTTLQMKGRRKDSAKKLCRSLPTQTRNNKTKQFELPGKPKRNSSLKKGPPSQKSPAIKQEPNESVGSRKSLQQRSRSSVSQKAKQKVRGKSADSYESMWADISRQQDRKEEVKMDNNVVQGNSSGVLL